MLPAAYRSLYLDFQHTLTQLNQQLKPMQGEPFASASLVQTAFQAVQHSFQQLLNLDWDQLDPNLTVRVQSYQTEINRQFRLLSMDMMFLRAARQSATETQRRQQVSDRINSLIQYCEGLLGAADGEE